jgi:hypothetical protein
MCNIIISNAHRRENDNGGVGCTLWELSDSKTIALWRSVPWGAFERSQSAANAASKAATRLDDVPNSILAKSVLIRIPTASASIDKTSFLEMLQNTRRVHESMMS